MIGQLPNWHRASRRTPAGAPRATSKSNIQKAADRNGLSLILLRYKSAQVIPHRYAPPRAGEGPAGVSCSLLEGRRTAAARIPRNGKYLRFYINKRWPSEPETLAWASADRWEEPQDVQASSFAIRYEITTTMHTGSVIIIYFK